MRNAYENLHRLPAVRRPALLPRRRVVLAVLPLTGCQWTLISGKMPKACGCSNRRTILVALQKFQQAVQTDPANPDSYYNMAATYHKMADLHHQKTDLQQAEAYYHQCLDRDPNDQDCYRGLAVLLVSEQRQQDAQKLLEGWAESAIRRRPGRRSN